MLITGHKMHVAGLLEQAASKPLSVAFSRHAWDTCWRLCYGRTMNHEIDVNGTLTNLASRSTSADLTVKSKAQRASLQVSSKLDYSIIAINVSFDNLRIS